jgi:hypothetical protein
MQHQVSGGGPSSSAQPLCDNNISLPKVSGRMSVKRKFGTLNASSCFRALFELQAIAIRARVKLIQEFSLKHEDVDMQPVDGPS